MTIRLVTSHVVNLHGAARVGDTVRFRLLDGMVTATEHAPADVQSVTIDASGNISMSLYCPANYDCIIANAMRFQFALPDSAASTTLELLHLAQGFPITVVNELQSLIDAHVAAPNPHPQYALIGSGQMTTDLLAADLTIPLGSTYTHPNLIVGAGVTLTVLGTLYVP